MSKLDNSIAIEWSKRLRDEWINHNLNGILNLFEKVAEYYEGPFSSPVSSKDDINALWEETKFQNIENLEIDLIAFEKGKSAMHWYLKYIDTRDGNTYEMDGTYEVHFNEDGLCIYFKQWWVMSY